MRVFTRFFRIYDLVGSVYVYSVCGSPSFWSLLLLFGCSLLFLWGLSMVLQYILLVFVCILAIGVIPNLVLYLIDILVYEPRLRRKTDHK